MNRRGHDNEVERATVENWLEDSDVAILYGHGEYTDRTRIHDPNYFDPFIQ